MVITIGLLFVYDYLWFENEVALRDGVGARKLLVWFCLTVTRAEQTLLGIVVGHGDRLGWAEIVLLLFIDLSQIKA